MKNKIYIQGAIADMQEQITFDSAKHKYTRNSDQKFLAGTSTIAGLLPKADFLAPWAAKEAVKALGYYDEIEGEKHLEDIAKLSDIKKIIHDASIGEFYTLLKEAKGSYAKKSKDAKDIGTEGHKILETYVKDRISGGICRLIKNENPTLNKAFVSFFEWEKENEVEWVASEFLVYSPEYEFAGTGDAIAILKKKYLALPDFKFANRISEDFYLQTAGYCIPFEKYGITFDKRIILRFPKTEWLPEWDKKTMRYKRVPNVFEAFEITSPYSFDRETFLALRNVYKWINLKEK